MFYEIKKTCPKQKKFKQSCSSAPSKHLALLNSAQAYFEVDLKNYLIHLQDRNISRKFL